MSTGGAAVARTGPTVGVRHMAGVDDHAGRATVLVVGSLTEWPSGLEHGLGRV